MIKACRFFFPLALALLLPVLPGYAATEQSLNKPLVVEMFTTPNCGACVPAERFMLDLAKQPDTIALSCVIENWESDVDDPSGLDPCFFRLWSYYNDQNNDSQIWVPNAVISGKNPMRARDLERVKQNITLERRDVINPTQRIFLQWDDPETLSINLPRAPRGFGENKTHSVYLIRYQAKDIRKIEGGKNDGRVFRYTNVVKDTDHVGVWYGEVRTIKVKVRPEPENPDEAGGYAVLTQDMAGQIISAAGQIADYSIVNDPETRLRKEIEERQAEIEALRAKLGQAPEDDSGKAENTGEPRTVRPGN